MGGFGNCRKREGYKAQVIRRQGDKRGDGKMVEIADTDKEKREKRKEGEYNSKPSIFTWLATSTPDHKFACKPTSRLLR